MWPIRRSYQAERLVLRGRDFAWGARTYLMAVINATPDSFSGDGLDGSLAQAVQLARRFEAEGADIIDIGAESTRPGAPPVDAAEELRRLLPVLNAVRAVSTLPISVDTYRAATAVAALDAGADLVNDIHGLRHDPGLAHVLAARGAPVVVMHNQRGRPFTDVADDVCLGLAESLALAASAGIPPANIILDPGFGFGWQPEQNLEMLRRLPEAWVLGYPLLLGTSRKSTIGFVLGAEAGDRLEGTAATVAAAIAGGADIVRVHDVRPMARVARMSDAIWRANWQAEQP